MACVLSHRIVCAVFIVMLLTSSTLAIVGGVLWALLWYYKGLPIIAILIPSFVTGFLLSAVLFRFTPFGEYDLITGFLL